MKLRSVPKKKPEREDHYKVTFSLPSSRVELSNRSRLAATFRVYDQKNLLGILKIGRGSLKWIPKEKGVGKQERGVTAMPWAEFAKKMRK